MDLENTDNSNQSVEDNVPIDVTEDSPPSIEKNEDTILQSSASAKDSKTRNTKLPLARVRHIMRMDPECQLISADSVFIVTRATELFLHDIAIQMVKYTLQNKRKTILKRDFDAAIESNPTLCFLDGTID